MDTKLGPCLCGGPEKVKRDADGKPYIERCPLYIQIRGRHPQTGEEMDQWGCSLSFVPLLLIETAAQVRGAQAATESLRNELVGRLDNAAAERHLERLMRAQAAPRGVDGPLRGAPVGAPVGVIEAAGDPDAEDN